MYIVENTEELLGIVHQAALNLLKTEVDNPSFKEHSKE